MPRHVTKTLDSVLKALGVERGQEPWLEPGRESGRARRRGDLATARRLAIERNDRIVLAAAKVRGEGVCFDCHKTLERDDICFDHRPPIRRPGNDRYNRSGLILAWRILRDDPSERNVVVVCRACERKSTVRGSVRSFGVGAGPRRNPRERYLRAYTTRARNRAMTLLEPHCPECAATPVSECVFAHREPVHGPRPFGTGFRLALAILRGDYSPTLLWRCRPLCHARLTREESAGYMKRRGFPAQVKITNCSRTKPLEEYVETS